ncbi:MAG: LysR family transcriptional regulator [Roseobacter sp.]|jgi:DNA-binding transcriptional LysR family regulator|uniref:HTH-type transcriptional regulator GltR n=4 Tax=Sulfitobacter TaxID=60136 RepID=A0A1H3C9T9_9RHOB|nr:MULTISPECIES: LysR family transcriptional regulator [Sulfitobacter]MAN09620.1 LysR family transcriptional regulator [Roseobacter sp.]AXI52059.1 LysR family transcriptional regulator [Sulfitobacter sp. SK025]EAP82069.1 transcriptional regulator, LysR family protein [Sulfitobacter sp. NAS-14.1]EAP85277.1 transcriptional regulator, LysR family protein [Sulfitobacter sp. EE-36]KAJ29344.1 LysR family transcriptional regulator [Sulfitobacter pontiacus 3SOLIMAR09]|tara:strand:- start:8239 stop:9114 length:876 start_codon:yes stop_codon:yes gene_type:complete
MDNWEEIKTAYQVARMGTVSGAAEVLGVHHATVIRHVDALERRLSVKLFQRHARGYKTTEAGEDLLRVASATDDQFSQLASRIKGRGEAVSGELVVTSLMELSSWMTPLLVAFQRENPDVTLRFLTGERLFRLEYGEAHIAIRAGQVPEQPDNVVQPFYQFQMGLFAHKDYIAAFGMPSGVEEYGNHRFVGHDDAQMRAPFFKWMREVVPAHAISFRGLHADALRVAVLEAAGIGFVDLIEGRANPDLVEVHPHLPEWDSMLWLVTHVDLHRTPKVQALLSYLKKAVKTGL